VTEVIESHISGDFSGWKHHAEFRLVNGQVWRQESPDSFYYHSHGVAVTIRANGQDGVLEVAGIPTTVRVRRLG
jgi:hypothetical protein